MKIKKEDLECDIEVNIDIKNSIPKTDNEFRCDICHRVFAKSWTDEEAYNESKELFGKISEEELGIICDDCFSIFISSARKK